MAPVGAVHLPPPRRLGHRAGRLEVVGEVPGEHERPAEALGLGDVAGGVDERGVVVVGHRVRGEPVRASARRRGPGPRRRRRRPSAPTAPMRNEPPGIASRSSGGCRPAGGRPARRRDRGPASRRRRGRGHSRRSRAPDSVESAESGGPSKAGRWSWASVVLLGLARRPCEDHMVRHSTGREGAAHLDRGGAHGHRHVHRLRRCVRQRRRRRGRLRRAEGAAHRGRAAGRVRRRGRRPPRRRQGQDHQEARDPDPRRRGARWRRRSGHRPGRRPVPVRGHRRRPARGDDGRRGACSVRSPVTPPRA